MESGRLGSGEEAMYLSPVLKEHQVLCSIIIIMIIVIIIVIIIIIIIIIKIKIIITIIEISKNYKQ